MGEYFGCNYSVFPFPVEPLTSAPSSGLLSTLYRTDETFMNLRAHTHTHTPAVCTKPLFLPFVPDGELRTFVPWPSQSQLSMDRMICSVKTMQSGPTFHLYWQPEEHNSAPRGAKKVLQPDRAIQSDNWVVNPEESLAAFGLNYLLPEFWTTRRRHEAFVCGALKSQRHAWNPGECCLWLWWQWGIWWRGKKF